MRVIVTGASGLIGGEVCRQLRVTRPDWEVVSVGRTDPRIPGVQHLACDLVTRDLPPLGRPDAVLHLAQSHAYRHLPEEIEEVVALNVLATARLLEAARREGASCFVNASSGSVYGSAPTGAPRHVADESDIGTYAATKRAGELLVGSYRDYLSVVSLRYFTVYGPGQDHRMLIPSLISRVRGGELIQIRQESGPVLTPTHVSDAASATLNAIGVPSGAYDVCGPSPISLRDICDAIGLFVGIPPRYELVDGPAVPVTGVARPDLLGAPVVHPVEGIRQLCQMS